MKNKEIMMVLAGLLLLASACEKDGGVYGSGNKVPITFSMSSSGYDSDDDELRHFEVREPETVVAPMGSDNLYLYATLKEDRAEEQDSSELRAQVGLTAGQKVRIAAYKGAVQQGATRTYTYNGSTLTPDGGTPVMVEGDGSTYTFVAYSYYGARTTAPAESGITPDKDLVWGSSAPQVITSVSSTYTVSLNMTHRFSRVRVRINASTHASAITNIGTVTVTGGKTANLTVQTGDVAPTSTDAPQNVNFPSSTSATRTSDYSVYYRDVTGVNISTITVTFTAGGSRTATNLSLAFSETLTVGRSYTLEIGVKKLRFAGSNIYVSGGAPTFSESSASSLQGLSFKQGSLVGISPIGGATTGTVGAVVIWFPAGSGWTKTTIAGSTWGSFAAIPSTGSYGGDICAKVKTGWRLPTAAEFIAAGPYTVGTSGSSNTINEDGSGNVVNIYNGSFVSRLSPGGSRLSDGTKYTLCIYMTSSAVVQLPNVVDQSSIGSCPVRCITEE
jgi:hypothetical protein